MACNENVVKNMANEITRNCQAYNVNVDSQFVIYLIDLWLLNPRYGKVFAKTINRTNLAYFVEDCVNTISHGDTALSTLKIQFILQTNYDHLQNLINKHHDTIQKCLRPLFNEILIVDPENEIEFEKLFRRISLYIILASGLGNPEYIITLKEGIAALQSVIEMEDLKVFVSLSRAEKITELEKLLGIVCGVRLFNRNCKKGGEGIPDLTSNLVDSGNSCMTLLSKTLISVMQRVNSLTTAISETIIIDDETGNVIIDVTRNPEVTTENYKEIFDLLAFNRQLELFIRKLLSDVDFMTQNGAQYVERIKAVFEELHTAVKYKEAVPVQNVFPLFTKVWEEWRAMQDVMFLVSIVNRLISILNSIQERIKMPYKVINKMLKEKIVVSDQTRIEERPSTVERLSLASLPNYVQYVGSSDNARKQSTEESGAVTCEFLGFCALCLGVGALVPSNTKIGRIKFNGAYYGFCNVKMAIRFSKEPERYINEVINYARNNAQLINLLNIVEHVYNVKDIDDLVIIRVPKVKSFDKDIQTETHPHAEFKPMNYTSNLWHWKKRACQWASVVNCQTHSTQTAYSHLRSEIHCQTVNPSDKCLQTMTDSATNTISSNQFIWGLRGKRAYGQHSMDLTLKQSPSKPKVHSVTACIWPCIEMQEEKSEGSEMSDDFKDFYYPVMDSASRQFDYD